MEHDNLATESVDIPVFFLAPDAPISEDAEPAFFVSMALTEMVMAEMCQKINDDETHTVFLSDYALLDVNVAWQSAVEQIESVQLHLKKGPQLAVMICTDNREQFISPWLEFAPEFDLGLDDEDVE
ncbi:hypothetical protein [Pseudoalteromonas sp. G4]|uniref:hypothetical protein n=1 Tax=Pseudoalteromonas sp. G4 TaxID=2992761 RepID=UPI00237EE7AC|nr:hypothetical protein [Pseudoalteromonas sp. G4]MDE3274174.1 hypothetical protein [Pseudoalteromonas sp. G4]